MTDRLIVIDADGHICEPEAVWTDYTRTEFRDRVLQVRTEGEESYLVIDGEERRGGTGAGPKSSSCASSCQRSSRTLRDHGTHRGGASRAAELSPGSHRTRPGSDRASQPPRRHDSRLVGG